MSKKENKELKQKQEKNKCQCENVNCTCGDDCDCGDDCHCGDECHCGDNCNCGEECHCHENNKECQCSKENNETTELLSKRIKELEDSLLRSQAELLNYRKRKDEETARILKYAEEDVLKSFLPILDNFERAIAMESDNNFGDETSKFLEGFRLVYNQTKSLLEKFEVKEIDCLDKEFDPAIEQAISTEKNKDKPSGTVLKVYQKGYMYKDKVLRLAMVIVNE